MNAKEIISRANSLGSSATMLKGAAKYLLKHHKYPRPIRLEGAQSISLVIRSAYKNAEEIRKSNPEAKRARDDVKFRRNFLRRLATEQHRLLSPSVSTVAEITAAVNAVADSNIRLLKIAKLRGIALGKTQTPTRVESPRAGIIVAGFTADYAKKHGAYIKMVGKDASLQATKASSYGVHHDSTPSVKRNGRWTGFERAQHDNYVRSFALIVNQWTVDYVFHEMTVRLTLPDSCSWSQDSNGLKVARGPDDYHPDAGELLANDSVAKILAKLAERAETRKLYAAQRAAEAAEMEGVFCCVADSLKAGNCRQGTEQFAINHHLDPRRHYKATELLQIADGKTGRVRLVIRAACNRHRSEVERGFSNLSDHGAVLR